MLTSLCVDCERYSTVLFSWNHRVSVADTPIGSNTLFDVIMHPLVVKCHGTNETGYSDITESSACVLMLCIVT